MGKLLFLILLPFALIAGCGPSSTARDTEKQQQNQFLRKQVSQMKAVEGKWIGCMTPFASRLPSAEEVNKILADAISDQIVYSEKISKAAVAVSRGKGGSHPSPAPKPNPDDGNIPPIMVDPGAPKPRPAPTPTPTPPPSTACRGGETVILQVLVVDMLQADPSRNEVVEVPTLTGVFKTASSADILVVFTSGLYRDDGGLVQLTSATVPGTSSAISPTILQMQMDGDQMTGRYIAPQNLSDVIFHKVQ